MKIKIILDIPHYYDPDEVLFPAGSVLDATLDPSWTPADAERNAPRWFVQTVLGPMGIYTHEAEELPE